MKTVVMGYKLTETYAVDVEKDKNGKYLTRPRTKLEHAEKEWEEIASYEEVPQSEKTIFSGSTVYLSEDEEVTVRREIFRVDLGYWIQYVDKRLDYIHNLDEIEDQLNEEIKKYNESMIENDPDAKAYCDLHKLVYADTDYDDLRQYIKPNDDGYTASLSIPWDGLEFAPLLYPTPYKLGGKISPTI